MTRRVGTSVTLFSLRAEKVACDFLARRFPYARMPVDVFECALERHDAVRLAGDVRMQADGHHPSGFRALTVEHIKLVADHAFELPRRVLGTHNGRGVVELIRIWNGDEGLAAHVHHVGLVVVDPVGDVDAALVGQVIKRVPGFLQAGAEPADRALAGGAADAIE
jgi:hypothetical protein